jgi:hypothetical protein
VIPALASKGRRPIPGRRWGLPGFQRLCATVRREEVADEPRDDRLHRSHPPLICQGREIALREGENLLGRTDEAVVWIDSPKVCPADILASRSAVGRRCWKTSAAETGPICTARECVGRQASSTATSPSASLMVAESGGSLSGIRTGRRKKRAREGDRLNAARSVASGGV